jgi:hypothetical protein
MSVSVLINIVVEDIYAGDFNVADPKASKPDSKPPKLIEALD